MLRPEPLKNSQRIKSSARNSASRAQSERKRKIRLAFLWIYRFVSYTTISCLLGHLTSAVAGRPIEQRTFQNRSESTHDGLKGKKAADEIDL